MSHSSFSSSASTIIIDEVPNKTQRTEGARDATSAKQLVRKMVFHEVPNISLRKAFNTMFLLLVESVLGGGGEGVLQEYNWSTTGVPNNTWHKKTNSYHPGGSPG